MIAKGVLASLCLFATALGATPSALPPDLAKAAAAYDKAQIEGDRAELNRLLADDYHLVNGSGEIETKLQFVAESSDPAFKLEPFTVQSPIEAVWGDGAVLAGEVRIKGTDHGKTFQAHFRFADIWRKSHGKWQVVFTEVTRLPP
ncbi:MAG: hypothetical protein JWM63_4496 [Gammaproteobacteria bacterium]|nr:hypothetical protein [Gammaproteobacteria bacterium]